MKGLVKKLVEMLGDRETYAMAESELTLLRTVALPAMVGELASEQPVITSVRLARLIASSGDEAITELKRHRDNFDEDRDFWLVLALVWVPRTCRENENLWDFSLRLLDGNRLSEWAACRLLVFVWQFGGAEKRQWIEYNSRFWSDDPEKLDTVMRLRIGGALLVESNDLITQ